ncbi:DoxX family protein [Algoriphagus confluentis]|uniref:DoxX family protein n=2 Tax=Algoriphagus confluentis TaxID=1697556 RepID=A0ABQ6PI79_9BACT|nr:DoxX family protein [Algoriphagus confluentis]
MGYFYLIAGINHFLTPEFYLPLIPPFFSHPDLINTLSGVAEILLGLGILYFPTRTRAAWGVVLMLLAFIPAHVYFIQIGSCIEEGLCVSEWIGWVRLMIIHPILIFWAYWIAKNPRIYG